MNSAVTYDISGTIYAPSSTLNLRRGYLERQRLYYHHRQQHHLQQRFGFHAAPKQLRHLRISNPRGSAAAPT